MKRGARPGWVHLAACLTGASGLGLEVLATQLLSLEFGYGVAGPWTLALFIASWALGAKAAGRQSGSTARGLRFAAAGVVVGAAILFGLGGWLGWFAVGLIGLGQGTFLPWLTRCLGEGHARNLGLLFAANLLGAGLGAEAFGSFFPAHYGLLTAGLVACACVVAGGWIGAACAGTPGSAEPTRSGPRQTPSNPNTEGGDGPAGEEPSSRAPGAGLWPTGFLVAGVTAWAASLEWFGVRLGVLWLGGMQDALGAVLVSTMVALALGAAVLPRLLPGGTRGLVLLTLLCCAASLSLFHLPSLLGAVDEAPLYLRGLLLVGPALVPFGAWIPMLQARQEVADSSSLGDLLGYEALGALVGLPLVHFLLLPNLGLGPVVLLLAGLALLPLLLRRPEPLAWVGGLALVAWVFAGGLHRLHPALQSPPLQNPAFELLSFEEDEHFAVSVVNDGLQGERTLLTDGFRAAASGHDYGYMRALAHLPMLLHPQPSRVGVLAFGTGTTAGALSLHGELESLDVLELSATVLANAPHFEEVNRGVLEDPRVQTRVGDGRQTLRHHPGAYDVLTMEPLLPDSPFAVYLYTREFYLEARAALKPGGLLCQWVPPHALEPVTFDAVVSAFTEAFPWSGVWLFGTQVILLGGEALPELDPGRFPEPASELGRALAALGLEDATGIAGRFITAGEAWPRGERPLRDLDPWVIHRPRRRGSVLLADLPLNLALLRLLQQELPVAWTEASGGTPALDGNRMEALKWLRRARESMESERALASLQAEAQALPDREASLTGTRNRLLAETEFDDPTQLLDRARKLSPREPALLRLEATLEFQQSLRAGFALLNAGGGEETAGDAAMHLMRAVILRPERADSRAYLALALQRLKSDRAAGEIAKALELCPNLRNTVPGQRLDQLGFQWGSATPPGDGSQGQ